MMHDVLGSAWGRLFRQLGARRRRTRSGYPVDSATTGAEIKRTGVRGARPSRSASWRTCMKEAPEFASRRSAQAA